MVLGINWRHKVHSGRKLYLHGSRIMKHHLSTFLQHTGDIHDDIDTSMMDFLMQAFPGDFDYIQKVLLPTARIWLVVVTGDLTASQS